MRRDRRLKTLAAVAASAGLLAACGGEDEVSPQEYANQAAEAVLTLVEDLGAGSDVQEALSNPDNLDQAGQAIEEFEGVLGTVAGDLKEISPPSEAEEGHDMLVSATEDLESAAGSFVEVIDSGDEEAIVEAATDFEAAGEQFQQDFQEAGNTLEGAGIPEPTIDGPSS